MINYNNHNITGISYNNHSIKYVYGCGGNLVWSGGTGPTPPPTGMKFNAVYSDESTYSAECDSTSAITSGDFSSHTTVLTAMTFINVGNCVKSIGFRTFQNTSLTGFSLSTSVETIGPAAFSQCNYLTNVTLPESVTTIGGNAFYYCRRLKSINIPDSVSAITESMFSICTELSSCTISNNSSLTSIGSSAFSQCVSLVSINIPSSVTSFGNYCFYGCNNLTSITIPENTTKIPQYMITSGTALTTVTIPSTVTEIGSSAFRYCTNLEYIEILADFAPIIGNTVFHNTGNCPLYVPDASLQDYLTQWSGYADRIKPISEKP